MTAKGYAEQVKNDVAFVFSSEQGKRVMELLEQIGHYNIPTWHGDRDSFLLNEGKRQVVLTLKTILKWPVDKIEEEITKQLQ